MGRRRDLGTWLEGAPLEPEAADALGLPREGVGSRARLGRRIVALCVDWAACSVMSYAFFDWNATVTLVIFAAANLALLTLFGSTLGHYVMGLQLRPVTRRWPMILRAFVRTVLLCLVVPAVIWGPDGRGLHDAAAGMALVRFR